MIRKTRVKITLATMAILALVFVTIGVVAFTIMSNRPPRRIHVEIMFPEGASPTEPEFDSYVKKLEERLALEWLGWYSLVAGAGFLALSVVTYVLSGWIVQPIKETMEKQKQFVSDASHELKTPLSIISASADLLSASEQEQRWLSNIKEQAARMQLLTNDLITLARLDEARRVGAERINLSETVESCVLGFESIIFEAGKTLSTEIAENVFVAANKEEIVRATGILIDNAVKYSSCGAEIRVCLSKHSDKVSLTVYNTGSSVSEAEKGKIFHRFYRSEYSRSREGGGYGLGLAILKSIADKNGWRISVTSDGGYTEFAIHF